MLRYALAMPQQATISQLKFAQGLALGKHATVAYKLAHPNSKMGPKALGVAASRAKKKKSVQDELARLLAEPMLQPLILHPCPEYQDASKIIEHAVGVMVRLTNHPDPLVQMHAAVWLFDYGKTLKEERKARSKDSREQILSELRGLYAKSLPDPALIVDAVPESDSMES